MLSRQIISCIVSVFIVNNYVNAAELTLVTETKIAAIPSLPSSNGVQKGQYEASGLTVDQEGVWYVVMDNSLRILTVKPVEGPEGWLWTNASLSPVNGADDQSEYEAITYDNRKSLNFYTMEEMNRHKRAEVKKYNSALTPPPVNEPTSVVFSDRNKGFEGAEWIWHCYDQDTNGDNYILGLCEGNNCTDSKSGTGVIQVLRKKTGTPTLWELFTDQNSILPNGELKLPKSFRDYSGIALYPAYPKTCDCSDVCDGSGEYTIAITSQQDSKLWLGQLNTKNWSLSNGATYNFPQSEEKKYCNIEGVSILSLTKENDKVISARFAIASDAYGGTDNACKATDQSLHIFDLPVE